MLFWRIQCHIGHATTNLDMLGVAYFCLLFNEITTLVDMERTKRKCFFLYTKLYLEVSHMFWRSVHLHSAAAWQLWVWNYKFWRNNVINIFKSAVRHMLYFQRAACLMERSDLSLGSQFLSPFLLSLPKPHLFTAEALVYTISHILCLFLRDLSCVVRQEVAKLYAHWSVFPEAFLKCLCQWQRFCLTF